MTTSPAAIPLGRAARALWTLREDASFLNQGSYGAVPRAVQEAQARLREELERHPDAFMQRVKPLEGAAVRAVAAQVAALVGTTASQVALVENTTSAVQSVLNSLPFQPGDQILVTDHQYNAVRMALAARCRQTGAEPLVVHIPLPTSAEAISERVLAATGPRVRLALLDHITSPTALAFPVKQLAHELHRRNILVFIDGAHAIGQVDLDIPAIGADWYVTNLHKWLFAPRGTAMLYASGSAAPLTQPLVSSHFVDLGFPRAFDYTGTRDYTAWLAAPAALAFYEQLGPQRLHAHQAALIGHGSRELAGIGAEAIALASLSAAMRAFRLPQSRPALADDALEVMGLLWERERIQIRCATLGGALLLRVCAQAYAEAAEFTALAEALQRHGWPARA
jgi:isopenicillin-N epimerase